MTELNITSLVGLLTRYDGDALNRLRERFPQAEDLFAPGKILGHTESALVVEALDGLAAEGLRVARDRIAVTTRLVDRRLRRAKLIRLAGNIVGGLSAAGVLGATILSNQMAAFLSAIITFASSSLVLVAEYVEGTLSGSENSPHALRIRLAGVIANTTQLDGELKLVPFIKPPHNERLALVRRANALTAEVRKIEFEAGVNG